MPGMRKQIKGTLADIKTSRGIYNRQAYPFFGYEQDIAGMRARLTAEQERQLMNPTVNPLYDIYAKRGLEQIGGTASLTGSPSGGQTQVAKGQFLADLAAQFGNQDKQLLARASEFRGLLPQTQEPQYDSNMIGGFNAFSNLLNAQAASQAASGGGGGMGFSSLLGSGSGMLAGRAMSPSTGPNAGSGDETAMSNPFGALFGKLFGGLSSFWGSGGISEASDFGGVGMASA